VQSCRGSTTASFASSAQAIKITLNPAFRGRADPILPSSSTLSNVVVNHLRERGLVAGRDDFRYRHTNRGIGLAGDALAMRQPSAVRCRFAVPEARLQADCHVSGSLSSDTGVNLNHSHRVHSPACRRVRGLHCRAILKHVFAVRLLWSSSNAFALKQRGVEESGSSNAVNAQGVARPIVQR